MKVYTYEIELKKYKFDNVIEKEFDNLEKEKDEYWIRYKGKDSLDFKLKIDEPIIRENEYEDILCYINTLERKDLSVIEEYLKNQIGKYISGKIDKHYDAIKNLQLKFKCCY